jgi:type IV pilus assembly protein PilM
MFNILRDPPPEYAFEVAADWIAMSRTGPPTNVQHVALNPGVIAPSPVKENILDQAAFASAVRRLMPNPAGRGKRKAALILPDNCVRLAVLDFEKFPEKEEDRRPLINFRLRKSVPFDIDEAALSYYPQAGNRVLVAVAPAEIIAHYEHPFRAAGFHPGLVTVSSLAIIDLLPRNESIVLAHRSPGALTVMGLNNGVVTIARTLEIEEDDEVIAAIYPTLTYIEDNEGARPARLYTTSHLPIDLDIPVEVIPNPYPGLSGYLASIQSSAGGFQSGVAA